MNHHDFVCEVCGNTTAECDCPDQDVQSSPALEAKDAEIERLREVLKKIRSEHQAHKIDCICYQGTPSECNCGSKKTCDQIDNALKGGE